MQVVRRSLTPGESVGRQVVACLEPRPRRTEDGIDILPAEVFVQRPWEGGLT